MTFGVTNSRKLASLKISSSKYVKKFFPPTLGKFIIEIEKKTSLNKENCWSNVTTPFGSIIVQSFWPKIYLNVLESRFPGFSEF